MKMENVIWHVRKHDMYEIEWIRIFIYNHRIISAEAYLLMRTE